MASNEDKFDLEKLKKNIVNSCERSTLIQKKIMNIYEIITKRKTVCEISQAQEYELWPSQSEEMETVMLMLIGETGKGKTALANGILNYTMQVSHLHAFRFSIPVYSSDVNKSDVESQTEQITIYSIPYVNGMDSNSNLKIIDTPGLLDTGGLTIQNDNLKKIKLFLENCTNKEMLSIGIVAESNLIDDTNIKRLIHGIRQIIDDLSYLKIFSIATFADMSTPTCFSVLENNSVKLDGKFKIDNSIVFSDSDFDDEDVQQQWTTWEENIVRLLSYVTQPFAADQTKSPASQDLQRKFTRLETSLTEANVQILTAAKYKFEKTLNFWEFGEAARKRSNSFCSTEVEPDTDGSIGTFFSVRSTISETFSVNYHHMKRLQLEKDKEIEKLNKVIETFPEVFDTYEQELEMGRKKAKEKAKENAMKKYKLRINHQNLTDTSKLSLSIQNSDSTANPSVTFTKISSIPDSDSTVNTQVPDTKILTISDPDITANTSIHVTEISTKPYSDSTAIPLVPGTDISATPDSDSTANSSVPVSEISSTPDYDSTANHSVTDTDISVVPVTEILTTTDSDSTTNPLLPVTEISTTPGSDSTANPSVHVSEISTTPESDSRANPSVLGTEILTKADTDSTSIPLVPVTEISIPPDSDSKDNLSAPVTEISTTPYSESTENTSVSVTEISITYDSESRANPPVPVTEISTTPASDSTANLSVSDTELSTTPDSDTEANPPVSVTEISTKPELANTANPLFPVNKISTVDSDSRSHPPVPATEISTTPDSSSTANPSVTVTEISATPNSDSTAYPPVHVTDISTTPDFDSTANTLVTVTEISTTPKSDSTANRPVLVSEISTKPDSDSTANYSVTGTDISTTPDSGIFPQDQIENLQISTKEDEHFSGFRHQSRPTNSLHKTENTSEMMMKSARGVLIKNIIKATTNVNGLMKLMKKSALIVLKTNPLLHIFSVVDHYYILSHNQLTSYPSVICTNPQWLNGMASIVLFLGITKAFSSKINSKSIPAIPVFTPVDLVHALHSVEHFMRHRNDILDEYDLRPSFMENLISQNNGTFKYNGKYIRLQPQIYLCNSHNLNGCYKANNCHLLHLCENYVVGNCQIKSCFHGHSLHTEHNNEILKYYHLNTLLEVDVIDLIILDPYSINYGTTSRKQRSKHKKSSSYQSISNEHLKSYLTFCNDYNNGSCNNEQCYSLHICVQLLISKKVCKLSNCKLNHDILDPSCITLLSWAGISTNESPKDILASVCENISMFQN